MATYPAIDAKSKAQVVKAEEYTAKTLGDVTDSATSTAADLNQNAKARGQYS